MNTHEQFMKRAMHLALRAKGKTAPNPLVGAVVVKHNRIIAEGYHHRAGEPHAEVLALEAAGNQARGAALYVTLEPCAHFGRTPPCVNRIVRSGIKEVYVGMIDPNPLTNGKGVAFLRRQRITVTVGFLEEELRRINEVFIKSVTTRLPLVTVKVAQSLDGRIATSTGDSKWISSDISRHLAHRMRGGFDAVMVGINTVLHDNPRLDAWFSKKQPAKIIVDTELSTPAQANLFSGHLKVILVTVPHKSGQETDNRRVLSQRATILEAREKDGQVNLKDMLKKLNQQGISNILVEGGGTLIGSLFDEKLVDRIAFFVSPKIIGGKQALSSVMGKGVARVDHAILIEDLRMRRISTDFLITGRVRYR